MQTVGFVAYGEDSAAKPVVHCLLADKVAYFYLAAVVFERRHAVLCQRAFAFIFLVVPVAFGVVQADIQIPLRGEIVVEQQLVILLRIVVGLVVIEMQCTSFVREVMLLAVVVFIIFFVVYMAVPVGGVHESAGIITPSVTFHLFLAGIVPCVVSALFAGKGYQFDGGIVIVVFSLQIIGVQSHRRPVYIPVRTDVGEPRIERPMIVDESRSHFHRLLVRMEGAVGTVEFCIGFHGEITRLHVDAGTESSCTVR